MFLFGIRQRPTLPGRLQPSTIGAERLNFCVRYGNRWDPFAIVTGMPMKGLCSPLSSWFPLRLFITAASFLETSRTLSRFSVIYAYPENRTSRFPSPCEKPISSIFPLVSLDSQIFLDQVLDRLVSSSSIRYRTSTDDLSPGSLPGVLLLSNGILILEVGFTLRCLQRLSRPHFASQLCPWQDNCCTSDASTPVLSY